MLVEMDVLWGNCSVLCGMYERGKVVVREWLCQSGLSKAPRLVFQIRMWKLYFHHVLWQHKHDFSYVVTSWREKKSQQTSKMCTRRGLPPHIDTGKCCLSPTPRVTRARVVLLPPTPLAPTCVLVFLLCVRSPCVCCASHVHRWVGCEVVSERW